MRNRLSVSVLISNASGLNRSPSGLTPLPQPHFLERLHGQPRRHLDRSGRSPTGRAILELLSRGDGLVTEVAEPFPMSLNSASKHIRLLERAGLVRQHVRGREHVLSFNVQPIDSAAEWIKSHRATVELWIGQRIP